MGDREEHKRLAGESAAEMAGPGMVVGLGHGSTAVWAVRRLAARYAAGELAGMVCVPCSRAVEAEARTLGLAVTGLDEHPEVDLTIDGADEVDPGLNLIKGGGGALLREKIVAQASRREIIVVDRSKLSPALGTRFALPVEVLPFAWRPEARFLSGLGGRATLRTGGDGAPRLTDQGNYILDYAGGPWPEAARLAELAATLDARAGVMGHGLFLGLAETVIVGGPDGARRLTRG